jgi:nitrate/nitrite transporter NarK
LPSSSVVIWATAVGLICTMGGIIGYLINKGFDTLKASIEKQFELLWLKFEEFKKEYNVTAASLQSHKEAETIREEMCRERHRKLEEEIEHLRDRKGERRHVESDQ